VTDDDILKLYSPVFEVDRNLPPEELEILSAALGTKTTLSAALAVCMTRLGGYQTEVNEDIKLEDLTWRGMRLAPKAIVSYNTTILQNNEYAGAIKIQGYGHLGNFATLTFEGMTDALKEHTRSLDSSLVLKYGDLSIVPVLRSYYLARSSKRPYHNGVKVLATRELNLNLEDIAQQAVDRYHNLDRKKVEYPII
jgi:hypothetical protein